MRPLTFSDKHTMFATAGKTGTRRSVSRTRSYKTSTKRRVIKEPDMSGMLMAAGLGLEEDKKKPKDKKAAARENFYKELNKYGMVALVGGTLINHSINASYKLMAALEGDSENYKYYEDKSKSYLKPHFSLPSHWHQPRITFGTPWYY